MPFTGTTVFAKTDRGRREIETREAKLDPRTRMLLIMIDGALSVDDLAAKLGNADALQAGLDKLYGLQMVDTVAAAQPAAPAAAATAPPAAGDEALERARREAVAALHDAMGPDADLFAARLEKAATRAQFLAELLKVADVLGNVAGGKKADAFVARVRQHLG